MAHERPSTGSFDRHVVFVNVRERPSRWSRPDQKFVLWFGQICPRFLVVHARSLEAAVEICADWIEDNAPGLFCDDYVADEYRREYADAIASGMDDDAAVEHARESAELDTFMTGSGHYLGAEEWGIWFENPSRAAMLDLLGRAPKGNRAA